MIIFYGTRGCRDCRTIEEALLSLCLAHELVQTGPRGKRPRGLPPGTRPPALVDGREIIQGHGTVLAHLDKLKGVKALWDKYQSDACYCDDEGNVE